MPSPATPAWIKPLFLVAALYDGLLGLAFLTVPLRIYAWMNVPPPNHPGYIQFPAAMLIIFGYAFWLVARDPVRRRDIIWLGCMLKIAYCAVVFAHAASAGGIPTIWTIFAVADLLFLFAFIAALRTLAPHAPAA